MRRKDTITKLPRLQPHKVLEGLDFRAYCGFPPCPVSVAYHIAGLFRGRKILQIVGFGHFAGNIFMDCKG